MWLESLSTNGKSLHSKGKIELLFIYLCYLIRYLQSTKRIVHRLASRLLTNLLKLKFLDPIGFIIV